MLAALEEDESDGDKLLDAARRLAGAFSELLKAAQPGSQEVSTLCLFVPLLHPSQSLAIRLFEMPSPELCTKISHVDDTNR